MRLGIAVQEQQRRAVAADARVDGASLRGEIAGLEAVEHARTVPVLSGR
jgi:hypothetical protein